MHVLIAPDKFKDAISAAEAAKAMAAGLIKAKPNATFTLLPLADGGEGTASLLTQLNNGTIYHRQVAGPRGDFIKAQWGYAKKLKQAYIELAEASGLQLLPPDFRNPLYTSTYGTGELIAAALRKGATSIFLGLGGSATNDGGTGMAAALGYRFMDKKGKLLMRPTANQLLQIRAISTEEVNPAVFECRFLAACDVNNPLLGPAGASYTFALQKGASPDMLPLLEDGLHHLSQIMERDLGIEAANIPGSGAAGGTGAGVLAFLRGKLTNGTDLILEMCGFEKELEKADLLLSGEGSFDESSLHGKLIGKLCEISKRKNKPLVAFCGKVNLPPRQIYPPTYRRSKIFRKMKPAWHPP